MALSPLGMSLMMQPPASQPRPGVVAPTDVLGAYNLSGNMAEQQYQAKLNQQNALWGGLAGLGSAGIIGGAHLFGPSNTSTGVMGKMFPSLFPSSASTSPVDLGNALYSNGNMTGILGVGPTEGGASAPAAAMDWSSPALGLDPSLLSGGAADAGTAGSVAADLGAGAAADAGSVAADLAPAVAADAAGAGAADAGGIGLADLIPLMFA
jgi:hypothetical protein